MRYVPTTILLATFTFLSAPAAQAQTHVWSVGFGGTSTISSNRIAADAGGNSYVTGLFQGTADFGGGPLVSAGSNDMFVAKYDAIGAHVWSQTFGSTGSDTGQEIQVDGSGNVLVIGRFETTVSFGGSALVSAGDDDVFIAKYNSAGAHIWSIAMGGTGFDSGSALAIDSSNNVYASGGFESTVDFGGGALVSAGAGDAFLAKYDSTGAHVWSQRFGDTGSDWLVSLAVDATNNLLAAGRFQGSVDFGGGALVSAGNDDWVMAKYDPAGLHLRSDRYGSTGQDRPTDLKEDAFGNILATGWISDTVDFGGGPLVSAGGTDAVLVKFLSSGAHFWSQSYGDTGNDRFNDVGVVALDDMIVVGRFQNTVDFGGGGLASAGGDDAVLVKYDTGGLHMWSQSFGSTGTDRGREMAIDPSESILLTGYFEGTVDFGGGGIVSGGGRDAFVAKFSSTVADTVYVDAGAGAGAGTGTSWADAYVDLQAGLADAQANPNVSDILVAEGTYRPAPPAASPGNTFSMVNGIALRGGYAGFGEPDPFLRDDVLHETVLSGDLNGDDAPAGVNRADNVWNVFLASAVDSTTEVEMVTITAGYTTSGTGGGAKVAAGSALLFDKCRFTDNLGFGGGAYVEQTSEGRFEGCTFSGNWAGNQSGGALAGWGDQTVVARNCVFDGNAAVRGGAIWWAEGSIEIDNCTFTNNSCPLEGAAINIQKADALITQTDFSDNTLTGINTGSGGGIWYSRSNAVGSVSLDVIGCNFVNNGDTDGIIDNGQGGGIFLAHVDDALIEDCLFLQNKARSTPGMQTATVDSSLTIRNCRFLGNEALDGAGAIYMGSNASSPDVVNCLFSGNTARTWIVSVLDGNFVNCTFAENTTLNGSTLATGGPGVGAGLVVRNTVLWGNVGQTGAPVERWQLQEFNTGTITIDNSIVEGWTGGLGGVGNSGSDPLFTDPAGPDLTVGTLDDDLTIPSVSPARDTGDNAFVPAGVLTDLAGNDRIVGLSVDIGAYEFIPPVGVVAGLSQDASELRLAPTAPNPFNQSARISFGLPTAVQVHVQVVDVTGRAVRSLADGPFEAGDHSLIWNGRNDSGRRVNAGVYFVVVDAGADRASRKLVLLR